MRAEREATRNAVESGAVLAWANNKAVEIRRVEDIHSTGWEPFNGRDPNWSSPRFEWRVAPEPPPKPTVIEWIKGSPPPTVGVKYLQAYNGRIETIEWCPHNEQFMDTTGGWNAVEYWAPMSNLPGDKQ